MLSVKSNLDQLFGQIHDLAKTQGVPSPDLLAVSKTQPIEAIIPLLEAGHRRFGENRVQEAYQKWPLLKQQYSDVCLHLIGPLQTNKVRDALTLFDVIETVDRPKLAEMIAQHLPPKKHLKLLIQVNTGNELQKSGVPVSQFDSLYRRCKTLNLPIVGLMCLPPVHEAPLPHFQLLAALAKKYDLPYLSMGMSHDFPEAITCGTTWVRIGTALFGKR
jgi:PLP dependent protein